MLWDSKHMFWLLLERTPAPGHTGAVLVLADRTRTLHSTQALHVCVWFVPHTGQLLASLAGRATLLPQPALAT